MNQNQIQQLTLHLSQALDQNYDVVNMEAVLSVICALEGTTITKDQLEATRLAKYINQLRRRTKNEQLARRAKSLLKKWREMVGIQQTNDSQPSQSQQLPQPQSLPFSLSHSLGIGDNNDINASSIHHQLSSSLQYTSTTQNIISDLHSNIDSSETSTTATTITFPNAITHIENNEENLLNHSSKTANKHQRAIETQKLTTFVNDHSSSSVSNLATVTSDQLNQASIVIDIVSDSDDNDNSGNQPASQKFASSLSSLSLPAVQYQRTKKMKKDKKRKEKTQQHSLVDIREVKTQKTQSKIGSKSTDLNSFPAQDAKMPIIYPPDSEILSLSNSSMSSILSSDALSANSQNKQRTTSDLSFAGRFKSVSQVDSSNFDNSAVTLPNGANPTVCRINDKSNVDQPMPARQVYDYINNDSSTSCSRLSPFEELEAKQSHNQSQIHLKPFAEPNKQQVSRHLTLKPKDSYSAALALTTTEYQESLSSQVPKKRGRKKGSKGVDSIIAKESRLSQQILFGSGVKKVKTTKELFNEIQGRKLSMAFNRSDTNSASHYLTNCSKIRNRESSQSLTRPTSSCSETSVHSPQNLEAYSGNIGLSGIESKFCNVHDDTGNTDSDTITSEPSRDSMKSGKIKRSPSSDSISNSLQTSSVQNAVSISSARNHADVTTQLMHLVNSLSSPLSVNDTEHLYQSQIVPCTCIIIEETQNLSTGENNLASQLDKSGRDLDETKSSNENDSTVQYMRKSLQMPQKIKRALVEETTIPIPQKPMKSIFDLDFDDDEDPLNSIIKESVLSEEATSNPQGSINNDNNIANDSKLINLRNDAINIDMQPVAVLEGDNSEKVPEILSMYTVHEDPNCVAKKRFIVQTNNITNFHVNALHNYYVPNINGNWNSIEPSISVFFNEPDTYNVTDGADVVPKYGSLIYNRIPKDLSLLKFGKKIGRKFLKTCMPTFLGVAKCLPSCRLESKRAKKLMKSLSVLQNSHLKAEFDPKSEPNIEKGEEHTNPLRVDVYTHDNNNRNENQKQMHMQVFEESGTETGVCATSEATLGCNLLKLVNNCNNSTAWPDDEGMSSITSRSSSICSNSSLKTTQNSINEKLRNQRAQISNAEHIERNRKKRRKNMKLSELDYIAPDKDASNPKPRIKRIKIAINGNFATQRQISLASSSNTSENSDDESKSVKRGDLSDIEATGYLTVDTAAICNHVKSRSASEDEQEHEHGLIRSRSTTIDDSIGADEEDIHLENKNENDYDYNSNDEEYAIVQRPIMGGSHNHIVLTIKKTPSKINSPVNSISAKSPIVALTSTGANVLEVEGDSANETAKYINFNNNHNSNDGNNSNSPQTITAIHHHQYHNLSSDAIPFRTDKILENSSHNKCQKCYRCRCQCRLRRYCCRRPQKHHSCRKETIDIELKHLFNNSDIIARSSQSKKRKPHRKLFFSSELNREDNIGRKERIINYSSSSSNYDEDDNSEQENLSFKKSDKINDIQYTTNCNLKMETDAKARACITNIAARNSEQRQQEQEPHPHVSSSDNESIEDEFICGAQNQYADKDNGTKYEPIGFEFPLNNNFMLPSFNSIYAENVENATLASDVKAITSQQSLQIENCDDVNSLCYNNNNLSLSKPLILASNSPVNNNNNNDNDSNDERASIIIENNSSKMLENSESVNVNPPNDEYRTGIRTIELKEDFKSSRFQKFKEWHEVLHLQSYNNEPLIVLPYVVLE